MQRTLYTFNNVKNRLWPRIAALTGLVLAGLALLSGHAAAQTGPLPTTVPEYPTPYHSPIFHSGGASTPYPLTGIDPLIDPLFGQLQGTPTGYYPLPPAAGAVPTQIPSFLLGPYDPTRPPAGPGVYYPSHLADGTIDSWSAPLNFVPQSISGFTVDDTQTTAIAAGQPGAGSVFTVVNGPWTQVTTGDVAGTATNGEYYQLGPGSPPVGTVYGVSWTLTATTPGSYSVYFHIPDNIDDGAGNIETRNTNVTYRITVTTAAIGVINTAATVSQTEANSSQYLAGPFQLQAGDTVQVRLQRADADPNATPPIVAINDLTDANGNKGNYTLVADSMSLQPTFGDVQSTPTAINRTAYPNEFNSANLRYWGIAPGTRGAVITSTGTLAQILTGNAPPDVDGGGNPILHSGFTTQATASDISETAIVAGSHLIRQLVYFGRSEPAATNQPNAQVFADDSSTSFAGGQLFKTVVNTGTGVATATNGEYRTTPAVATGAPTATATAGTWTLTVPFSGNYYVTVHLPGQTAGETRITDAQYTVTANGVTVGTYPVNQAATFGDYRLPTGSITVQAGQTITVSLSNVTADAPTTPVQAIVADSVRINTVSSGSAIYCVDGFNGAVVWRFQTPDAANGPSAPVFSSPAVARINVLTSNGTYQNKLVVIVGDNNGLVYCLDAIGNGDGTSNANSINPTTGQPVYGTQPLYGGPAPVQVGQAGYTPHVGTTGVYWIYRPDANRPKNPTTGLPRLDQSGHAVFVPTSDLPVPAAFGTASPTIYVDPSVNVTNPTATDTNAMVYVGNSNGVLYALDATGVPIDGTSATTFANTGDRFNVSQDLGGAAAGFVIPTCQPKWWFTLRGPSPNDTTNTSSADIESAPALYVRTVTPAVTVPGTTTRTTNYVPTVYIGSAHEQESTSNVGRLYALNGLYGPSGNNGASNSDPAAANYKAPGSANYNVGQKPQTDANDTRDWSFPDALNTNTGPTAGFAHQSKNGLPRPALGNITGSPVVFTNLNHETLNNGARQTRIYFAANTGLEVAAGSANGTTASPRPDETQTGRVWAVNLDGSVGTTTNSGNVQANGLNVWAYPLANDPNDSDLDPNGATPRAEPLGPIGSFLHATPAIGFVQFPSRIDDGTDINPVTNANNPYNPVDSVNPGGTGIKGQSVPMLYVGTRGVNDTALYAIDIDGAMTPGPVTAANPVPSVATDSLTIYRQISPDGSLFQSSPVLVTNATTSGGNGGIVLITAGNTLYDFSATPISNPITTQNFPLIREDRAYTGFGPISGPALAAFDVSDIQGYGPTSTVGTPGVAGSPTGNVQDWIYIGDSSSGFCKGLTPFDLSDPYIAVTLLDTLPVNLSPPGTVDLSSIIQTYLVSDANRKSTSAADALPVGRSAALPVYEWGQNVYIRFTNVVPPAPSGGGPLVYIHDGGGPAASAANPITVYANGGPIEFDLSDVDDSTTSTSDTPNPAPTVDHGTIPALLPAVPAAAGAALPNGIYQRSDTPAVAEPTSNLVDDAGKGYIGAYTYAISDGSARRNTPGGRRQVVNAHQTVMAYSFDGSNYTPGTPTTIVLAATATNGNEVTVQTGTTNGKPDYGFKTVTPVDQPTFGILNPLGLRAGGIPLPYATTLPAPPPPVSAEQIGDELGPFRPVSTTNGTISSTPNSLLLPLPAAYDLEALTNGNSVYQGAAPPSTSGIGDPTKLIPLGSANSIIPPISPHTVVTSTPLIRHNTSGDNSDLSGAPDLLNGVSNMPQGKSDASNGLSASPNQYFGTVSNPYAANIFDRTPLGFLGNRTVSTKMNVPTDSNGSNPGVSGGLYWNDNVPTVNGHTAVVNYLPWETPPASYKLGSANSSPDYPDISSQNVTTTLRSTYGAADLQAGSGTLTPATGVSSDLTGRTLYASALQIHVTVPHYQPANQQVYVGNGTSYNPSGELPPVSGNTNYITTTTFPMGYITTRRIYVPTRSGRYQSSAAYRDLSIYTGVPVDMSTSIDNPTTDIGKVPAAFGVQTEQYTPAVNPLGLFTPYNPAFQDYFKPLEIHNDGNVNLLNVHLDQKINNSGVQGTLLLHSDANDPLSSIAGYDLSGITGPRTGTFSANNVNVPEEPFLIRSSLDTDLVRTYGRNTGIANDPTQNPLYPGVTFHKPTPGSDAPSVLSVPDSPESAGSPYYVPPSANGLPATGFTAPPYVSVAIPFGTPVGIYSTSPPQEMTSLRLFDGFDTAATFGYSTDAANKPNNYLYPPQYGQAVGGINTPAVSPTNGEPVDTSGQPEDIYNGAQPLSTKGTQLTATVVEQRMTDGNTFGAVPMIDPGSAGVNAANNTVSAPDFAPAAFRDPTSGHLSVYWTSGRRGPGLYDIYGANVPFQSPTNTNPLGYFYPFDATQNWWNSIGGYSAPNVLQPVPNLTAGTNSGLTITQDYNNPANIFAFAVNVASTTPPYNNTLYCYPVTPATGALTASQVVTNDPGQVKYGIRGIYTGANFTNNLWAFWTASTRGRTAISYNSRTAATDSSAWPLTASLLPLPAGLTSVADPSPLLMTAPEVNPDGTLTGKSQSVIEVTYSGTGPNGTVDLYTSRYVPDATPVSKLDLTPYPQVTEVLTPVTGSGWYQARDVAWSRTGALNVLVNGTAILYSQAAPFGPLFTKATYDKASGLLVLTGISGGTSFTPANRTITAYVDAATGRVRFTGGTPVGQVEAIFNPLAKRLTTDSRADTAPVTFLDDAYKANAGTGLPNVQASRRWTIWRKSGTGGDPASTTLYYKTQRLTYYLSSQVDTTQSITFPGTGYTGAYDVYNVPGTPSRPAGSARIYFPIASGLEGQPITVKYTPIGATVPITTGQDYVLWQDELRANDEAVPILTSTAGLAAVNQGYAVPIETAVNENNVAAFLDPDALLNTATTLPTDLRSHKVWLFWNSTRKGTADIYSETIDPLF